MNDGGGSESHSALVAHRGISGEDNIVVITVMMCCTF